MSVPPVNHHNHNETLCCPASALWVSVFDDYKHNWWVLIKDPGYRDRITSSATNWLLPTQIDTNYSISVSSVIPVLATWLQNLVMLWIGVIHQLMQYGRLNGFTMEFTKYHYWELGRTPNNQSNIKTTRLRLNILQITDMMNLKFWIDVLWNHILTV